MAVFDGLSWMSIFLCLCAFQIENLLCLQGNLNELNLGSTVYLGGYAGDYNPNAGITSNFKGAIQRVNIL